MSSSKRRITALAAAVMAAFALLDAQAAPPTAAESMSRQSSIYDRDQRGQTAAQSIAPGGLRGGMDSKLLAIARTLKIDKGTLGNKQFDQMNQARQNAAEDRTGRVWFNGPSGVKDNTGLEVSRLKLEEHKAVMGLAALALTAQGFNWNEYKRRRKEILDSWGPNHVPPDQAIEAERINAYIRKHGPITSKFSPLIPGLTPKESNELRKKAVSYRYFDGKWKLADAQGRDLVRMALEEKERKRAEEESKAKQEKKNAAFSVKTRITMRPKTAADSKPRANLAGLNREFGGEGKSMVERMQEAKDSGMVQSGAPEITKEELEKYFPGLKPGGSIESSNEGVNWIVQRMQRDAEQNRPSPKKDGNVARRKGKPVSLLDSLTTLVFGVRNAQAGESASNDGKTQPRPDLRPQDAPEEVVTGFAHEDGREYRPDRYIEATEELGQLSLPENRHVKEKREEYEKFAQDLAKDVRVVEKAAQKAGGKDKEYSDEEALKPVEGDALSAINSETAPQGTFIDRVLEGRYGSVAEEAAQFADDLVHSTGSLTLREFNDDARLIANSVKARTADAYISELRKILRGNPEILNIVPDAEQQLNTLAAEKFGIGLPPDDPKGSTTYLFLSRSMGEAEIRRIFKAAGESSRDDLVIVFRGIPEGTEIGQAVEELQRWSKDMKNPANGIIDPTLFKEYDVKVVPTVVRAKGRNVIAQAIDPKTGDYEQPPENSARKKGAMVAKVAGLDNDRWLKDQIELGERGDLGIRGVVSEISEPDLIEVMKQKVAQVDWEAKKAEAVKNAWKHQRFVRLPTAAKPATRTKDPTFIVQEDLLDIGGRPIRKKGERINPLEIRPFTMRLLVFNPLSKEELNRVDFFLSRNKLAGRAMPTLIATQIDKDKGWDDYKALTDKYDAHVFVLTEDVKESFGIQATPSIVSGDNTKHVFVIDELGPVDDDPAERK